MIDAGVHGDPVEPGGELGVLPEPVERAVDLDEDFLGDVLGIVVVAGELVGDAIHHRPMPLDERLKGGRVAARRARDQVRRQPFRCRHMHMDAELEPAVDRATIVSGIDGVTDLNGLGVYDC